MRALLACALGAALFLIVPISALPHAYFSSIDFAQAYSLTQVDATHRAANSLLSDPPTQMQPWLAFARDELAAGRFPFWNPCNGNGAPLFANFQSALFSPFSLPLYVLPWKLGLVVSAWSKLAAIALFTWLYLRRVGASAAASALGAVAFALCGHNVLLLCYPHSGVTVVLPASLYFLELGAQRFERARRANLAAPLCGLLLALVAGFYAGHPEPYFFCVALVGAYALARLWRLHRGAGLALASVAKLGCAWLATAACAAGLCAPQALPFLEYLEHSQVLSERSKMQTPLRADLAALQFFPNALGNPGAGALLSHELPPPNYELANMSWVGPVVVLLALTALFVARRGLARAFLAFAAAWIVYACDAFGIGHWIAELPLLGLAPINRSQPVFAFALCVVAACGLDALLVCARAARATGDARVARAPRSLNVASEGRAEPGRRIARAWSPRVLIALVLGALLVAAAAWSALDHRAAFAAAIRHDAWFDQYTTREFAIAAIGCALVLAALALVSKRRESPSVRLAWTLPALAFAFPFAQWMRYNPTTPDRLHVPRTDALDALIAHVGTEQLAIVGEDTLPPCTNLRYGLRLSTNYDALWVRDHDQLYREMCGGRGNWRTTQRLSELALRLFGVRWVLARWDWLPVENGMARAAWSGPQRELVPLELRAGQRWSQTFRPGRAGLSSVAVWLSAPPSAASARARIVVLNPLDESVVAEALVDGAMLATRAASAQADEPRSALPGSWFALHFAALAEDGPRALELRIHGEVGEAGASIAAWRSAESIYPKGGLRTPHGDEPGTLVHDFAFRGADFERVAELSRFGLYRYANALPRYYVVERALVVADVLGGLRALLSGSFDAGACALFVGDAPRAVARVELAPSDDQNRRALRSDALARPAAAEIVREDPCRIELRAHADAPALLSTSLAYFPGWRARVNGVETAVLESNLAFQAVELPAGDSTIVLEYAPTDWRRACWIAAGSALAFALLLALVWRRIRAQR